MIALPDRDFAAPGRRALAALIDAALAALAVVFLALLAWRAGLLFVDASEPASAVLREFVRAFGLLLAGAGALGLVACHAALGASPGQLMVGCEVVRSRGGRRPGVARAAWRLACLVLTAAPLGVGMLWSLRDSRRRALHDRLAGTEVLVEDESRVDLARLLERVG